MRTKYPVHSVLDVQIIEIEQQRSLRFKTNTDSSVCKLVWLRKCDLTCKLCIKADEPTRSGALQFT